MRVSAACTAIALMAVAACGASAGGRPVGPGASPEAARIPAVPVLATFKTARIGGVTVLTTGKGAVLYSFTLDTATRSRCDGQCATTWHPLTGPMLAIAIMGTFSVIKRPDGSVQTTYNGHPLYTYVGDTVAGRASGNGVRQSGGVWKEIVVSRSG